MRQLDKETKEIRGTYEPSKEIESLELSNYSKEYLPKAPSNWPPRIQKLWNMRCRDLKDAGYLTEAFLVGLRQYCFAVMMAEDAQNALMKDGYLTPETGTNGQTYEVPSKWLTVLEKAEKTIDRYEKKFGFTPYDLQKIPKAKKIETTEENLLA